MPSTFKKLITKAMTNELSDDDLLASNIRLVTVPLSYEIKGLTTVVGSWYKIAVNSKIPLNQQWSALIHELIHIYLGHISDDSKSALQKEWEVEKCQESKNFYFVS